MIAALPAILAKTVWWAFTLVIGHIVFKILASLGVAVVTYQGMTIAIDWLMQEGMRQIQSLPKDILGLLTTLKVGVCVSMYASAIAMRAALDFSITGSIKRLVLL